MGKSSSGQSVSFRNLAILTPQNNFRKNRKYSTSGFNSPFLINFPNNILPGYKYSTPYINSRYKPVLDNQYVLFIIEKNYLSSTKVRRSPTDPLLNSPAKPTLILPPESRSDLYRVFNSLHVESVLVIPVLCLYVEGQVDNRCYCIPSL